MDSNGRIMEASNGFFSFSSQFLYPGTNRGQSRDQRRHQILWAVGLGKISSNERPVLKQRNKAWFTSQNGELLVDGGLVVICAMDRGWLRVIRWGYKEVARAGSCVNQLRLRRSMLTQL